MDHPDEGPLGEQILDDDADEWMASDGEGSDNELTEPDGGEQSQAPLPAHLKEISSLASWTVSSHKPSCGVASLRHPSPEFFWQSDGPQPHFLNIHFFKLVSIAHIRVYLDYDLDESYTPTKLHFVAGTGHHDLQDVCIMSFKEPKGWLDVDLSNAGGPNVFENEDFEGGGSADENACGERRKGGRQRRPLGHGPTLRCMLLQLRILENHQNGKDTHLRGLQIFALDESALRMGRRRAVNGTRAKKTLSATTDTFEGHNGSDAPAGVSTTTGHGNASSDTESAAPHWKTKPVFGLREPEWMGEPVLR